MRVVNGGNNFLIRRGSSGVKVANYDELTNVKQGFKEYRLV